MRKNGSRVAAAMGIGFIAAAVIAVFIVLAINSYVKAYADDRILTAEQLIQLYGKDKTDTTNISFLKPDCILVLGAGVWSGDRPSHMLEDRLLMGVALYEAGISDRLLMSGDHGSISYDEVNVMKNFAKARGVASENIFMDHAGFSTYESLFRAKEIFEATNIIIVTQRYHMFRTLYIAEKLGLNAYGVASDPRDYAGQDYREAREVLARVKDFFYVLVKPQPTYLGDKVPISGSGDVTND